MDIQQYKSNTLVDIAYMALKSDIAKTVLAQGQKIVLRELSERYGISETPIKQALNRLVSDGLVESIPRRGMKVKVVRWEEIENLFETRYMIETFYVKKAIMHVKENPKVLKEMARLLNEHERVIRNTSDINEYYKNYDVDFKFHQLYIKCSGNERIKDIYNNLRIHGYISYVYGRQDMDQMIKGVEEHKAIYKALEEHNEDELRTNIENHIENAKKKVRNAFLNDKKSN